MTVAKIIILHISNFMKTKSIRNPADYCYFIKDIQLAKGGKVSSGEFNQVWRYGANVIDEEAGNKNEKVMAQIIEYLLKRI